MEAVRGWVWIFSEIAQCKSACCLGKEILPQNCGRINLVAFYLVLSAD